MAFGVLVDFNAKVGQFIGDVNRLNRGLGDIQGNLGGIRAAGITAFKYLAAGVSVAAVGKLVHDTLDAADAMQKLSQRTGVAVEELTGLKLASDLSDSNIDEVGKAVNKLSKEMGTNAEELAKIGITAKSPIEALYQLADVFVAIEDPQQRAAVLAKILGKSWEEVAPLLSGGGKALQEIVDRGSKASGITTKLANTSAELNDKMTELTASYQGLVIKGVAPAIPALKELVDFFGTTSEKTKGVSEDNENAARFYKFLAGTIATAGTAADIAGKYVGALGAELVALATLDFSGAHAIDEAFREDIGKAEDRLSDFFTKLNGENVDLNVNVKTIGTGTGASQDLNEKYKKFAEGGKEVNDELKNTGVEMNKTLEKQLKDIERNIDDEVGLYQVRNAKLETALDLGLVDQESYYAKKQDLQKGQLAETQALLDKEIDALKQFQAQATDQATKDGAQEKINDLIQKKTELEREGQIATLQNAAEARKALGDYAGSLTDVNELLKGVASNIIDISQAQAKLDLKTPDTGPATAADLFDPNKIFRSADGKSFSDSPLKVGIELDLSDSQVAAVDNRLAQVEEQAKPFEIGTSIDTNKAVESLKKTLEEVQVNVQPIIIPVVYQPQTTPTQAPAGAAPGGVSVDELARAALAQGGR